MKNSSDETSDSKIVNNDHAQMNLRKKLDYMVKVFAKDYFIVLIANLLNDKVEISSCAEPFVPLLSHTLSISDSYKSFLEFYTRQYVCDNDRAEFKSAMDPDNIRKRLSDSGTYSFMSHHMYQERNCPTEITLIDVSDKQDGSICIFAARFIEDVIRQQTALRKQDDMVKTLVQDYNAIYHIDLDADTFLILQAHNVVNEELYNYAYRNMPYESAMKKFIDDMVCEEDQEAMTRLSACKYIKERLEHEKGYSYRYQVTPMRGMQFFEMRIIRAKTETDGHFAIMTVRNVDETAHEELRVQHDIEKINKKLANALSAAEKANESKSDFISNVSHDMRTPLNAILGYDHLALDTDSSEVKNNYLRKIGQAGDTLLSLINETLDLQKIENGITTLNIEPIACDEISSAIIIAVKPLMDLKKINFEFDNKIPPDTYIEADAMCVEEIFINLLSNAAKFTPEGGKVLFTLECEKETQDEVFYLITVKDTGTGISREFLPKIYEPFTQERTEETAGIGGSGLGLSIVKRLVDRMQGRIEVTSTIGIGTEFKVFLTFSKADKTKTADTEDAVNHEELKGKSILLCEDNEMNREIATAILEKEGVYVIQAINGKDGVDHFMRSKNHGIDAVLMDIRMPVMDGFEAAKAIRSLDRPDAATVPIIALSADAYNETIRKTREYGMTGHLSKPIDPAILIKVLTTNIELATK